MSNLRKSAITILFFNYQLLQTKVFNKKINANLYKKQLGKQTKKVILYPIKIIRINLTASVN